MRSTRTPTTGSPGNPRTMKLAVETRLALGLCLLGYVMAAGAALEIPSRLLLAGYAGFALMVAGHAHGSSAMHVPVAAAWVDLAFAAAAVWLEPSLAWPMCLPFLFPAAMVVAAGEAPRGSERPTRSPSVINGARLIIESLSTRESGPQDEVGGPTRTRAARG